ncbi:MAG: carboxypeptidase regulatory-like domain-containing protein, partial [Bacteroidota bacterium]
MIVLLVMAFGLAKAQRVNGRVLDRSQHPVSGALVFLAGDSSRFSLTDSSGYFLLQQLKEGRQLLVVRSAGFIPVTEEILITTGKSTFKEIFLDPTNTLLELVGVTAACTPNTPGTYGITIEKTLRMPANFFDPLRLTSVLPAVSSGNDQANGISFRGYSPNGLLWRLEGMDIVNPNHLANAGTLSDRPVANGGGVSILSAQVLDRSEFHYGILPASAGNALSGMLDMSLRK